jgi:hypothetical protein
MSETDGLLKLFAQAVRAILDEIKGLPDSRQKLSLKMNAAFGVLSAILLAIFAIPSLLTELAEVIRAIRGQEVPGNSGWATIVGFICLLIYFLVCIWITQPKSPPANPRTGRTA